MKIIIVGGGLEGLTASIALKTTFKSSIQVVLLEAPSIPEDKGAHIYLMDPCLRPLLKWMPESQYLQKWLKESCDSTETFMHISKIRKLLLRSQNIIRGIGNRYIKHFERLLKIQEWRS